MAKAFRIEVTLVQSAAGASASQRNIWAGEFS